MSTRSAPKRVRTGDARDRAADVLVRIETDAAFAAPVLDAALDRAPALPAAERGLCTELVYGVLRSAPALDTRLEAHAPRAGSIAKLDPYARAVLRIAAYQLLGLARIPPRAAVHRAVEALKRDRSPGLAGFANAVLRKLTAERPEPLPDDARVTLALASVPPRVLTSLRGALGSEDEARAMLRAAFAMRPATTVRVQPSRGTREALAARLREERPGATITEGRLSPWALRVSDAGALESTRAYAEGLFGIQEEGAQCVALAADVRPGMRVLDACAGRGGKTAALATLMERSGVLHAAELYPDRVAQVPRELERLGLLHEGLAFKSAAVDLTVGLGALESARPREGYDRVVLDAPCSGLGTLAHRPEIAARVGGAAEATGEHGQRDDRGSREDLVGLQAKLLRRMAAVVRPGGVLVYAVCTLTHEEGAAQVERFLAAHAGWALVEGSELVPERLRSAQVTLRPDRDGTDGFLVFRLQRKNEA